MGTTIKEVDFGVANTYKTDDGYVIEINYKLKDFPVLREKILTHEREHSRTKGFWKNRKIDALTDLKFRDLFPVYRKYPKLFWQQNIPINYSKEKNTLFIDYSLLFLYIFYAGILVLIYFLVNLFSTNSVFFWKIIKYTGIILGITIVLSFIGKKLKKAVNEESVKLKSNKK